MGLLLNHLDVPKVAVQVVGAGHQIEKWIMPTFGHSLKYVGVPLEGQAV
jgi:hypothetical protein